MPRTALEYANGIVIMHRALSINQAQRLVCSDCGKPCRTETERQLHTQRTGHESFQEQAASAAAIDTAAEMREASDATEQEMVRWCGQLGGVSVLPCVVTEAGGLMHCIAGCQEKLRGLFKSSATIFTHPSNITGSTRGG